MTALTDVVDNLRADLDNNIICILVSLDYSKAYDKKKLQSYAKIWYLKKKIKNYFFYRI